MKVYKKKYMGYFLTEILLASVLSSIVLFCIFSNYLFMKDLFVKQKAFANEQENIRMAYLLFSRLINQSSTIKIIAKSNLSHDLRSHSDALELKTNQQKMLVYLRSTQRKNNCSLYLKEDDQHAKEVIPGVSTMQLRFDEREKYTQICLGFDHARVKMKMPLYKHEW